MKKTYKNEKTGLILELDGPVIRVREGKQQSRMHFGDAGFAATLAESLARDLRAVEWCAVCGEESAKRKGVCGSCMSAQPALFYNLKTGEIL